MTSDIILSKLKDLGYTTPPSTFYSHIDNWDAWYRGNVPDFHSYRVYNGMRHVKCRKLTAGMAKNVCESWADLLMNSKACTILKRFILMY